MGVILIVLGAGILWLGTQQWRSRPKGDAEPEDPAWLRGLDAFTLPKAFLTGLVLSVANSKNLPMAVGAGTVIARADLGVGSALASLDRIVFVEPVAVGSARLPLNHCARERGRPAEAAVKTYASPSLTVISSWPPMWHPHASRSRSPRTSSPISHSPGGPSS
ncbi:MAG: hypothetical protein GY708_30745 [Actinomycetia bacterium]|nr:hypothetical protein [Actinomycetes bacterium]